MRSLNQGGDVLLFSRRSTTCLRREYEFNHLLVRSKLIILYLIIPSCALYQKIKAIKPTHINRGFRTVEFLLWISNNPSLIFVEKLNHTVLELWIIVDEFPPQIRLANEISKLIRLIHICQTALLLQAISCLCIIYWRRRYTICSICESRWLFTTWYLATAIYLMNCIQKIYPEHTEKEISFQSWIFTV